MALAGALAVAMLCGCRTPVQLVQPEQFSQKITGVRAKVKREPVSYEMFASRGGMTLEVFNSTAKPMRIEPTSYVVIGTTTNQIPLRAENILAKGSVLMQLPPLIDDAGWNPTFTDLERTSSRPVPAYYPEMHTTEWPPVDYRSSRSEVRSQYAWRWPKGRILLHLDFSQAKEHFEQEFVFER